MYTVYIYSRLLYCVCMPNNNPTTPHSDCEPLAKLNGRAKESSGLVGLKVIMCTRWCSLLLNVDTYRAILMGEHKKLRQANVQAH